MDFGIVVLFIVIALIGRAIEAMQKGQQRPPQQQPRPQQGRPLPQQRQQQGRPLPQQEEPRATTTLPSHGRYGDDEADDDATEDAAAAMIPDDMWEILTGRPKPRPQPAPPPVPVPPWEADDDYYDVEDDADEDRVPEQAYHDEVAEHERRRRLREAERLRQRQELMERRRQERNRSRAARAPVVRPLERPVPSAAARHTAFHEKVDMVPPASGPRRRRSQRDWLFAGDDMKRAIVLQEVLGPPKGLE